MKELKPIFKFVIKKINVKFEISKLKRNLLKY